MNIVPTLNFGGNCREAIHMYEKAFDGKISCLTMTGSKTLAKSIQFVTERFLMREEYIPKTIGMFEENVEMDVVPSGFAFIGGDAEFSESLLKKYGKCLYIDGDLTLKDGSESCFNKAEKIIVNGEEGGIQKRDTL